MATVQDRDASLRRPSEPDRRYSAHVFAATSHRYDDLAQPQQAHLPQEAFVTVRPSIGTSFGSGSIISEASSGLSVKEVELPDAVLDSLKARDPGTYRCIGIDPESSCPSSVESFEEKHPPATTTIQLSPAADYSHSIATKAALEDLVSSYPLPEVQTSRRWLLLRYSVFSTYRRLHALVLIANLIALSIMISRSVQTPPSFSYEGATTAVAANLLVGTLMRHEHCINLIFRVCVSLPHWLPLSIRRHTAKVYSYGGIHSACGISAFLWYVLFAVLLVYQYQVQPNDRWEMQTLCALTALVLVVFLVLIILAHPAIRMRWHDTWEMTHRFGGWLGVALVWTQLLIIVIESSHNSDVGLQLVQSPAFWFLLLITLMIIYPWLRLRRLTYTPEVLSSHAIRLNFTNRNQKTCRGVRLSTSPMLENHGFATIPNLEGGYSVLASRAGDWTEDLINNPPKKIWSRGAPTTGVARVAGLFKNVVIVATGSGIGPCMSWLVNNPNPGRLVWSARLPEQTYGAKLMGEVFQADEKALVIDTKVTGREPALLEVVYAMYRQVGAEAVVIISNPKVTREVVYGLESRNVPAYGAIFDS